MARKRKTTNPGNTSATADTVTSLKYPAKRRHIPPAGLEAQGRIAESPRVRYEYNPHLPPVLRFSNEPTKADQLSELLPIAHQRPLSDPEICMLADALRRHEPWLEWSGKREKPWFEADPMPVQIHERVSTQAILRVLASEEVQRSRFADPELECHQAVRFYLHDA
jgi:adenine-specific DNA-methyltransferase